MPRPLKSYPKGLKPYIFHGVDFRWKDGETQAFADCPFCGDDQDKFNVETSTGRWHCYPCQGGGGPASFVSLLWDTSFQHVTDYGELVEHRGIDGDTLMFWGVAKSILGDWWLVPAYSRNRRVTQIYKYSTRSSRSSRSILLGTPIGEPIMQHCIFGLEQFNEEKPEVYLCEGPWDAMVLWESLRRAKVGPDKALMPTANEGGSLLAEANVLGINGCGTFHESWASLFKDKIINILFDNDYPQEHPKSGNTLPPAGFAGVERTVRILRNTENPPAEINYLRWGEGGYTEGLPSGYDVRDFLLGAKT